MNDKSSDTAVEINVSGKRRRFDINDPVLPDWVEDVAFSSEGYPYDKVTDGVDAPSERHHNVPGRRCSNVAEITGAPT